MNIYHLLPSVVKSVISDPMILLIGVVIICWGIELVRFKRYFKAVAVLVFGYVLLNFLTLINSPYILGLGTDSFMESRSFAWSEAFFWFKTMSSALVVPVPITWKNYLLYILVGTTVYTVVFLISRNRNNRYKLIKYISVLAIVMVPVAKLHSAVEMYISDNESFESILKNFEHKPLKSSIANHLNVMLYIGESTSIMDMSVYGYPRKTTPNFDKLFSDEKGFLKFNNVFSTHIHTSQSLLEALSFWPNNNQDLLPIVRRQRISIVDQLNSLGVKTLLFSNQGSSGTWAQAATIIFQNAKSEFSTKNKSLGNMEITAERPYDHKFFNDTITPKLLDSLSQPSFVVFHSYAGHGPYLDNIPKDFRVKVDNFFNNQTKFSIDGGLGAVGYVEDYDSAMRYVDYSVSNAIEKVGASKQPWVFVYFSDHGESPYTISGHDSARFIHEMARVPFFIYFNRAAMEAQPELFKKYMQLSGESRVSTLKQFSSTLFDLLGVKINNASYSIPVIGEKIDISPIIVRDTIGGFKGVNLSDKKLPAPLVSASADTTKIFVQSKKRPELLCYLASDTIARELRGAITTNCLEFDIVVDHGNDVFVFHPKNPNASLTDSEKSDISLTIDKLFSVVEKYKNLSFWIDSKNIDDVQNCNRLQTTLAKKTNPDILVEFTSRSVNHLDELSSCISKLNKQENIHTDFYIPYELANKCAESLKSNMSFKDIDECKSLEKILQRVYTKSKFTDISFDYLGLKAIETIDVSKNFTWNTWNIDLDHLDSIKPGLFRMIIPNNNGDPNEAPIM